MKKILCLCMSIIFVMSLAVPSVLALESETKESETVSAEGAVSYTCVYDAESQKVIIDGTVSHDFLVTHKDYKIKVYAIAPDQTYDSVVNDPEVKPLGNTGMTVRFTFAIPVKGILERYSMYAVVVSSPENENFFTCEPMMPSISSSFVYNADDKSGFKGILSSSPADISNSGAGMVTVDVDVSKALGNAADSIPYPMSNSYINIKKSYIESIDKQVMAASLQGSKVYIRLLLHVNDKQLSECYIENSTQYTIPKLGSEYALEYIFTVSRFMAERYNGDRYGKISGMILGTAIDDMSLNNIGNMDVYSYAELYTLGLVVVGNAARAVRTDFDIVIPLSDTNDYTESYNGDLVIRPSQLLEQIISRLDKNVSGTYDCSVMLESTHSPLTISSDGEGENSLAANEDITGITADTIGVFTSFLSSLKAKYYSVPTNIIFKWSPDGALKGNLLCVSYVYKYLRLFANKYVSSFVLDTDKDKLLQLEECVKYIDTDSFSRLADIAKYYGYSSWEQLLGAQITPKRTHLLLETGFSHSRPAKIKGEFLYTDFTSTTVYSLMSAGQRCTYIRPDYNAEGERILSVASDKLGISETVETMGIFEYPESYEYTEYLSMKIGVADKGASSDAIYRLRLTLGNGADKLVAEGAVRNGQTEMLYFDVSEFSRRFKAEYIRISVSSLTGESPSCTVQLSELRGYSKTYSAEELSTLVEQKRAELKESVEGEEQGFDFVLWLTLIGIVFATVIVGIVLFMIFRRDERKENK